MRTSIRTRFSLALVGLAISPVLIVGIILAWRSFEVQQRQAFELQRQTVKRLAVEIDTSLRRFESDLRLVGQVRGLTNMSVTEQQRILQELLFYERAFDELSLLDSTGQELVRLSPVQIITEADLRSRAGADEFTVPKTTGATYYSPIWFDASTAEPLITIAVPLFGSDKDTVEQVLIAQARIKKIRELIGNMPIGSGESIFIVDTTERVIAHPDPSVVLRGTHFPLPSQEGIAPGLNTTTVVFAAEHIQLGQQRLTVIAARAWSEALALSISTLYITGGSLLLAFIVAVVIGIGMIRRLVRPIQDLADTARAIQAGDLSQRASVASGDEIEALAQAFNDMTARLQTTLHGLEQRVAERTLDLQHANQELSFAKQAAEEANHLKTQFLANMSHELRTPLNAIINFTKFLSKERYGSLTDPQRDLQQRVLSNAEHLLGVINDILDLAKIEAGRMDLVREQIDLATILRGVMATTVGLTKDKGLDLILDTPDVLPSIFGDKTRIRQVLLN